MPEFEIRPANANDLPRLMALDHSCSSDYVWQLELRREPNQLTANFREVRLPRTVDVKYPRNPFALAEEWTRRDAAFVALRENNPIGYICLTEEHTAAIAWVTDLVVAPEWRRKGAGSALLMAGQAWALERGARRLVLEMQSKNQACIRLMQKFGYEFCGYNDQYYPTQDIALFFGRALSKKKFGKVGMFNGWMESLLAGLQNINNILTAGIAITAFSLFLYALSFNLRDRVARSFAIILLCVVVVFTTEALQNNTVPNWGIELLLRLQWIGIIFLPPSYLHLSDALLVTAGRPSRGRRRLAVRLVYVLSVVFLVLLASGLLVGDLITDGKPAPHLQHTVWTQVFTLSYITIIVWAGINFIRAYQKMLTRSGQRRMLYLMAGATAPALGSYPYLLYGSGFAAHYQFIFWSTAFIINVLVAVLVILMAYAVAFFGVSWPDRVVKSRLFKWLLRGPVTASLALTLMTLVRRAGELFEGNPYTGFVPLVMVATVLLFEHAITLLSPLWERVLFFGRDRAEIQLLQNIEERLLTRSDLQQFLENVLAAVRDHLQSPCAFVAALDGEELSLSVVAGNRHMLEEENLTEALHLVKHNEDGERQEFIWGDFWVLPLHQRKMNGDRDEVPPLLGLLGIARKADHPLDGDQRDALWLLANRVAFALEDRQLQQRVFRSLEDLQPQMDMLQRIRAAGRYDSTANLLTEPKLEEADLADWVKDALTHYWGGPKLSNSPLMKLRIVQTLVDNYDGNASNALRALLRKAVDQVKPEGERRFTSEWILFNILEMKFIEGRKVREVAGRLAMSEADLYRKQRVAVEAVARAILDMEKNEGMG